MEQTIRILLVEDLPADAELAEREIRKSLKSCVFERVDTAEEFVGALARFQPDLIVSDYSMPRFDGLTALKLTLEKAPHTPLIMLTGTMNEDTAVECMRAGAANYVIKERIKRLGQSVLHALEEKRLGEERRHVVEALRASEERFRNLFENAQDLISILDAEGTVRFQSPSSQRVLGYTPEELTGQNIFRFVHADEVTTAKAAFDQLLQPHHRPARLELRFRHSDGSWRRLESVGKRLGEQDPPMVVVNSRDVTERHRLEEQLRQSQKMEAIGQLAAGVSHDFNNILTVIQGNASLLLEGEAGTGASAEAARQIIEAAERAAGLTRQLLLFSRKQVMQSAPLDLNEAVGNMTKMLQRILGEDITLQSRYAPGLPRVQADSGMIEQVLLNLAVNARDAMPSGGRLTIATSSEILDEDAVRDHPDASPGRWICLSLSDTGCGIAPENLSRIFEPFFTTKEIGKGTGLGLATVYGIVRQHRGWIEVASEMGKGTVFSIYLPVPDRSPAERPASVGSLDLPRGNELILVVEDEPSVRLLASHLLQRCGYSVLLAASGVHALAVWEAHKEQIQLLFTDMIMPDAMTGRELADALQREKPDLKVMFTSGYSAEVAGKEPVLVEGVNFLQKPYPPLRLAQAVRRCLDQARTAGQGLGTRGLEVAPRIVEDGESDAGGGGRVAPDPTEPLTGLASPTTQADGSGSQTDRE